MRVVDLRLPAQRGNDAMPVEFAPSEFMWRSPADVRLHACFGRWLAKNRGRLIGDWTLYRCPHGLPQG